MIGRTLEPEPLPLPGEEPEPGARDWPDMVEVQPWRPGPWLTLAVVLLLLRRRRR